MAISKTPSVSSLTVDGSLTYTITLSNSGNAVGHVTSIVDTLPTGFTFTASSASGLTTSNPTINGQILTWTGNWTVAAAASQTLAFDVTASSSAGTFLNRAAVSGSDFSTAKTGATASVTVSLPTPIISITKSASSDTVYTGATVNYTISLNNSGTGSGSITTISDTLPTGFTYIAGSSGGQLSGDPSINGQIVTWSDGWSIAEANSVLNFTFSAETNLNQGVYLNKAGAQGTNFSDVGTGETASVTTILPPNAQPVLVITVTASDDTVSSGGNLIYTITITNNGTGPAELTQIQNILPPGFTYQPGTTTGLTTNEPLIDGFQLTWNKSIQISQNGSSKTLSFTAKAGLSSNIYYSSVIVNGNNFDLVSTGSVAPVLVIAPMLTLSKNVSGTQADPGDIITYQLVYMNIGKDIATDIILKESIPLNTTYLTGSALGENMVITYSHNGGVAYDSLQTTPVTNLLFQRTLPLDPESSGTVDFKVIIK